MAIRPLLLGHRGARAEKSIPENSIASFDRALAQGCDGFEFDLRLSADGYPVVCHDPTVHSLEVEHCPAQQLGLPLLCDVLERYQTIAFLDIELKVSGLEAATLDLLRAHPPARGYVISSFLPEVLQAAHDMDATIPLGLICETRAQFSLWHNLPIKYVIPHKKLVTRRVATEIKSRGRKLLVWTVNSALDMRRFAEWEVDGIISDDSEKLVSTLGRKSESKHKK
ncbi:MAG: glycerophosphodiester phosphodiesterase [Candidatus Sulfotelmatobacter sp.]|jgi:glycerophosphoryl diester phosphodiesterase